MRSFLLLALTVTGCAHTGKATKADLADALPPGCEHSIAGTWMHENNASYQYSAIDDGTTAHLIPHRVNGDGTIAIDALDKSMDMDVTLERKIAGFSGDFRIVETLEGGEQCGILFLARITGCSPDRLTLQVEQSYAVNSSCQRVDFGQSDFVEHNLIRVKP